MFKIEKIKEDFFQAIKENDVVIISTPTSSGKTMMIPAWSAEISRRKVYCLVPRVIMARQASVGASRLVFKNTYDVGYMTGRGDIFGKKVIYATEGSYIARKIGENSSTGNITCVDEVHEQGAITEAVLYLFKKWITEGMKLVILSATMDCEEYANYYSEFSTKIITLSEANRKFQLEYETVSNPYKAIADATLDGHRCLVGVEGKGEIEQAIKDISFFLPSNELIPIFPFHAEMENEDQDAALKHKGAAIYVATNVLQSGITIPQVSRGYFNGWGKRIEDKRGIATLCRYKLSQAEMVQWFGRVARDCEGLIYQTHSEAEDFKNRDKMPTAEIKLIPLGDIMLQFFAYGIDMETAELLNKPSNKNIQSAKKMLKKLLLIRNNKLTSYGKNVISKGAGVRGGIIINAGETLGVENTMRKIQAIQYVGHPFRATGGYYFKEHKDFVYSDYMLWMKAIEKIIMEYGYRVSELDYERFKLEMEKAGIFRRNLTKLMKIFEKIDEECRDEIFTHDAVKCALYMANRDRLVDDGYLEDVGYIDKSFKSATTTEKYYFGDIVSVGGSTFIEGVTTISEEEKNKYQALLGIN